MEISLKLGSGVFGNWSENSTILVKITALVFIFYIFTCTYLGRNKGESSANRINNAKIDSKVNKDSGTIMFSTFSTVFSTELHDRGKFLH